MALQKSTLPRVGTFLLVCFASASLLLAQSSYWINHTVFNQQSFSAITTNAILSEQSRDAVAATIVDKVFEDAPIAKRVTGDRVTALVSGLLGTDLSNQAVSALSSRGYAYITSPNRTDISINLSQIKEPLSTIVGVAQNQGVDVRADPSEIPDEVVLLRNDALPDLSGAVTTMLWLSPLFWLGSILGFGLYIYFGRSQYQRRVYITLGTIIGLAILGLAAGPFIPPPVAAAVPTISLRPVAESLARGFLEPFNHQMYIMLGMSMLSLGIFHFRGSIKKAITTIGRSAK